MLHANIDEIYDLSHGSWDDEKQVVSDMGEKPWQLLMLLAFNVLEGPHRTQGRFQEVLDCMARMRDRFDERPQAIPLFMEMSLDIVKERGIPVSSPTVVQEAWAGMLDDGPLKRKHCTTNLNRFHGFTADGEMNIPEWYQKGYMLLQTSLEMDYFPKKSVAALRLRARNDGVLAEDGSRSTGRNVIAIEERAVRAGGVNAFAIATLVYADVTNLWKLKIATSAGGHNKLWSGMSNKALRNVKAVVPWLLQQLEGGFMDHVKDIVTCFLSEVQLKKVGFKLPANEDGIAADHGDVVFEDAMADHFVRYAFHLGGNRIKRELPLLRGWPTRCALFLSKKVGVASKALRQLKSDYDVFLVLRNDMEAELHGDLGPLVNRSIFHLSCVQQLVEICKLTGWTLTPDLLDWVSARFRRIIQSQLAEDGFRAEKGDAKVEVNTI